MSCAARLAPAASVGLVPALADSPAHVPAANDPLIGIWSIETTFVPALKGELAVARHGSTWHATCTYGTLAQLPGADADLGLEGAAEVSLVPKARVEGELSYQGRFRVPSASSLFNCSTALVFLGSSSSDRL
jgi:hypothetical protein